jgi:hypothetical protein
VAAPQALALKKFSTEGDHCVTAFFERRENGFQSKQVGNTNIAVYERIHLLVECDPNLPLV